MTMWLELLQKAVAASNRTQVAATLGVSRTSVSLLLSGKYGAGTSKMAELVIQTYTRTSCPYLGRDIPKSECDSHANAAIPTSSPRAMKHWRACITCPNKRSES
jgi:hypothetical protein